VLCTGIAYILYFRLIESAGPAKALTVTFLIPVFALGYGWTLLDEQVTVTMVVCGVVVMLGTAMSSGLLPRKR
jgi:drug/metabolite transporter (DMT)-like permease